MPHCLETYAYVIALLAARGNDAANVMMNGNGQPRLIIRAQGHAHAHAHAPQAQAPPPPPQQQQQQPPAHAPPAHAVPQQAPWPVTPPAVSSGHGPMPHGTQIELAELCLIKCRAS